MPALRDDLAAVLARIDGSGYRAYREIAGSWQLRGPGNLALELHVDHVQGDPFAAPSRVRVRVDRREAPAPPDLSDTRVRRVALADFLARRIAREFSRRRGTVGGTGKSGLLAIDVGGQEVLERASFVVADRFLEARVEVGLPAAGRRVLGRQAARLLAEELPAAIAAALAAAPGGGPWRLEDRARAFVDCIDNQEAIRRGLRERELVAFVADGAILPRESGASDRPLRGSDAVPFRSPGELRVAFDLPHPVSPGGSRQVSGMGIPEGVTLVVGGGYHGKSTLLDALQRCVHPHVPGDGREYVVTDPDAVKIRAEDGRAVTAVDISPFIRDLPGGRGTRSFHTDDASGSTSQATNIVEALEAGARVLLLDEDTSATNFMVRDARMQALVAREHEPIVPFVDRVRELHRRLGVSTILVMGGSGDYFDVADRVILMREYLPRDATEEARRIAAERPTGRRPEADEPLAAPRGRVVDPRCLDPSRGRREVKIDARGTEEIVFGTSTIDLRGVEQVADTSQLRAIGLALHLLANRFLDGRTPLPRALDMLEDLLDREGLDVLDPFHRPGRHPGRLARPRRHEVAAALSRFRGLRVRGSSAGAR